MITDSTRNDTQAVFRYLMNSRSVIRMSVGAVIGGIVRHEYVVIHEAPPRVVQEIVSKFRHISLTADGLLIPLTPLDTDN